MSGLRIRLFPQSPPVAALILVNPKHRTVCGMGFALAVRNLYVPTRGLRHRAEPPAGQQGMTAMAIEQFIDNEVKANDVVLFMKGTPQFPMCGFSGQVVQILDYLGVPYKGLNVLENDELRGGIKNYSNWPTIPQLYVKGEFVGGCDIIREMFQAGELQSMLKEKGIATKAAATA
jgi:monothiol glutaredoxin